jgi:uncharacterized MAPEG superfamily protein
MRALVILLLLIGPAMAKNGGIGSSIDSFEPRKQVVTPDGQSRRAEDGPNKAEMFLLMWRQAAGFKPIPDDLMKKYNLPPDVNSEPSK